MIYPRSIFPPNMIHCTSVICLLLSPLSQVIALQWMYIILSHYSFLVIKLSLPVPPPSFVCPRETASLPFVLHVHSHQHQLVRLLDAAEVYKIRLDRIVSSSRLVSNLYDDVIKQCNVDNLKDHTKPSGFKTWHPSILHKPLLVQRAAYTQSQ